MIAGNRGTIKQLVKIQDIFPSLVDLAGGTTTDELDGRSVKNLLFGQYEGWRTEFHGEHTLGKDSSQYILTDQWKFIWFPVLNHYQLFDMKKIRMK